MHHDVGTIFDWPQQDRRSDGVVDNQWHAMFVRNLGQSFDISDISRWVAHALAEDGTGILVDQSFDVFRTVTRGKARGDSAFWEDVCKESVSGAIELRERNDVISQLDDVDKRVLDGSHSGADTQRFDPAFQRGNPLLQHSICGVPDTSVDV